MNLPNWFLYSHRCCNNIKPSYERCCYLYNVAFLKKSQQLSLIIVFFNICFRFLNKCITLRLIIVLIIVKVMYSLVGSEAQQRFINNYAKSRYDCKRNPVLALINEAYFQSMTSCTHDMIYIVYTNFD